MTRTHRNISGTYEKIKASGCNINSKKFLQFFGRVLAENFAQKKKENHVSCFPTMWQSQGNQNPSLLSGR